MAFGSLQTPFYYSIKSMDLPLGQKSQRAVTFLYALHAASDMAVQ